MNASYLPSLRRLALRCRPCRIHSGPRISSNCRALANYFAVAKFWGKGKFFKRRGMFQNNNIKIDKTNKQTEKQPGDTSFSSLIPSPSSLFLPPLTVPVRRSLLSDFSVSRRMLNLDSAFFKRWPSSTHCASGSEKEEWK